MSFCTPELWAKDEFDVAVKFEAPVDELPPTLFERIDGGGAGGATDGGGGGGNVGIVKPAEMNCGKDEFD